jgi:hypothetical protein
MVISAEVAQAQVAGQLSLQVEVAAACMKVLETKTGIPDWMTGPWQRLMEFEGREVLQQDDFIQTLAQLPELLQLLVAGAMWTGREDATRVSGVSPIIVEALVVWWPGTSALVVGKRWYCHEMIRLLSKRRIIS